MSIALLNIAPEYIKERRYDKPNYPDPSLGAIFSYLNKYNIACNVIDSKLERLSFKKIVGRLTDIKPQAVGLTSFTHEIERVAYTAGVIKERLQKVKLIIGGPHANALPKEVLTEFPVFDMAVFGEGEEVIADLINNNLGNLETIQGLAYRKGEEIIVNRTRPFLDIENLPAIDWSSFPKARYYPIFTSRGCNYRCIFCSRPFGSKIRYRSLSAVIDEIRQVKKSFNPKVIYFWDENFCSDRRRTIELLERIMGDRAIKDIRWFCQAHIRDLDYELLRLMKKSGCIRLGIGIESGSEELLRKIGKGTTKDMIIEVVSWLKKIKIPFEGYFLLGLPNENWRTCMETVSFAAKLNPDFPVFGIMVPYPGTEIYQMAKQGKGGYKIISTKWRDYNKIIGKALELEGLSRRELEFIQFYGYISILVKNIRVFDIVRFIFQYYKDICSYLRNYLSNFL